MIVLEGIRKTYDSHEVLADVSFSVKKGDVLCITGSSGCGKSTILKIVSGIMKPDSGIIVRDSERIGYAFQNDILIPWKSAMENMVYILKGFYPINEAMERAGYWLEELGLTAACNRQPSEMSGGMRKRLSIARAFSIDPDILLLDEPFAFQDKENIAAIKKLVLDRGKSHDRAVILATHKLENMDKEGCRIIKIGKRPVVIP